jgi:cytochrome c oxidase assembly factor CtaG
VKTSDRIFVIGLVVAGAGWLMILASGWSAVFVVIAVVVMFVAISLFVLGLGASLAERRAERLRRNAGESDG